MSQKLFTFFFASKEGVSLVEGSAIKKDTILEKIMSRLDEMTILNELTVKAPDCTVVLADVYSAISVPMTAV